MYLSIRCHLSIVLVTTLLVLSGCFRVSGNAWYDGPPERPIEMLSYYHAPETYRGYREEITLTEAAFTLKHITIDTDIGPIVVDYYQTPKRTDSLVLVFPVLGGKNIIEKHIASYLAESGIDSAIINRSDEFKDPKNFDNLEDVLRRNITRDRLMLDFFETAYDKKKFGSFGISRGAINVALTAGVDDRLKYNVLVLGATDLVDVFRDSDQKRIKKYIKAVSKAKGITPEEFLVLLKEKLKTDPKNTAQYLDGRNTLLILGVFDKTVPFQYGLRLRDQIGRPATIFLVADHYLGFMYTQVVSFVPPRLGSGLFPFPYVEQEAVTFYRRSFDNQFNWKILPFRVLQFPFSVIAEVVANVGAGVEWVFGWSKNEPLADQDQYWLAAIKRQLEEDELRAVAPQCGPKEEAQADSPRG